MTETPKLYSLRVNGKTSIRKVINELLKVRIPFSVNPLSEESAVIAVPDWPDFNEVNCPDVLRKAFHKAIGE